MKSKLHTLLPYIAAIIFVFFVISRLFIIISKGTDIAGIEQNVIYSIQVLMDSGKLYLSPGEAPFAITQYMPIYYYLCSFTAKLTGYTANDIQALYIIGRTWNLLFNLLTALFIFKIGRNILQLSKNKSYFLYLLSFTFLFSHNFAVRPDSLHDMLAIASIYTFMLYIKRSQAGINAISLLFITVLLTSLSVFSKQSGIQMIIIFSGFCLLNKDWKSLIRIIIYSMFIYGGMFLLFRFLYHSFFENVIGGVVNGINIENFIKYIITKNIFILSVWPLILITLFLIIKNNTIFKGNPIERLLSLCALGSLIFAGVTALKMGSTVQYFIIFVNLSFLMIMKMLQKESDAAAKNDSTPFNYKQLSFYLYFTLIIFIYGAQNAKLILNFDHNLALERQRTAALQVAAYIDKTRVKNSGRFIFANLTTDYTIPSRQRINNIFFKDCLVPQMDILEYSTGPSKVIGYENLKNMMQSGEVEYMIESSPASKFAIINNLDSIKTSNFKLVKEIDGYLIYKFSQN